MASLGDFEFVGGSIVVKWRLSRYFLWYIMRLSSNSRSDACVTVKGVNKTY